MTVRIGAISADESEIAPRALAEDGSQTDDVSAFMGGAAAFTS
jgi:hypothetical protein